MSYVERDVCTPSSDGICVDLLSIITNNTPLTGGMKPSNVKCPWYKYTILGDRVCRGVLGWLLLYVMSYVVCLVGWQ